MSNGEKTEENIIDSFNFLLSGVEHFLMPEALKHAERLLKSIQELEKELKVVTEDRNGLMQINQQHRETIIELKKQLERRRRA